MGGRELRIGLTDVALRSQWGWMDGGKECLLTECHGHGRRRRNALFRSRRRRRRRQIDTLDAHCRGKKQGKEGREGRVVASLSSASVPPSFAVNRAARRAGGGPREASRDWADGGLLNLAPFGFFRNIFY